MKPKNFPGRKKQRQIEAANRKHPEGRPDYTHWTEAQMEEYGHAYNVRTKKRRVE